MRQVQKMNKPTTNENHKANILMNIMFYLFLLFLIRYQIELLTYIEWGDESETIVTAKMMASGKYLYSEIFNHHGPLTFISGLFLEKFGNFGVAAHRVPILILQLLALSALYFSPLIKGQYINKKLYVIITASIMVLYLPEFFSHMYKYQVIAGLFLVIILSQYSLPTIVCPEYLKQTQIILGNILISSLPFLAISYLPLSTILFIAALKKNYVGKSTFWLGIGITFNILFLYYVGSIKGYLAFHLYLNLTILPLYTTALTLPNIISILYLISNNISQLGIIFLLFYCLTISSTKEKTIPWRSCLIGLGMISLLVRGINFHALPYFYAISAFPLIILYSKKISFSVVVTVMFVSIVFLIKLSLFVTSDRLKLTSNQVPKYTEFSNLVKFLTMKDDKIIAYPFNSFEYIASDRLPASGYFFYLPWQQKYNENPQLGIKIDPCNDIRLNKPKIILAIKIRNTDSLPEWDSYAECVNKILAQDYKLLLNDNFYFRNDVAQNTGLNLIEDSSYNIRPSNQLTTNSPINISIAPINREEFYLKKINIKFATYNQLQSGFAELRLKTSNEEVARYKFSLSELIDNQYHSFNLKNNNYISGEIISLGGEGISTWESINADKIVTTCVVYEYSNGLVKFTPGCTRF